jgi:hypothetical protein
MTAETKVCFECKETKPAAEFYPHPQHRDGLSTRCRVCSLADMQRRWRAKNPLREWVMPTEKACSRCKVIKPIDEYPLTPASKDGHASDCKACRSVLASKWNKANKKRRSELASIYYQRHPDKVKDYELLRRLGVPRGTYAKMLAAQNGKCAICQTTNPGSRVKRFQFDHCHEKLMWRGLLCNRCNRGLGYFSHDPEILIAAANYLKSRESPSV